MLLFTNEYIEKLEKQYQDKPKNAFYYVATLPRNLEIRQQAEVWLNELSETNRNALIRRFKKSHQNFADTYHELAIGVLFQRANLNPQYDKKIDGKTPDWHIPAIHNSPDCIVEVSSLYMPEYEMKFQRYLSIIRGEILKIPFKVVLAVQLKDIELNILETLELETHLKLLKSWLMSKPEDGSILESDIFEFELVEWNDEYEHIELIGPFHSSYVNSKRLDSKVEEKILKYIGLAKTYRYPLILVIVVDWMTSIDTKHFENLLFGRGTTVISKPAYSHIKGFEVNKSYTDLSGLFYQYPDSLSAVIFTTGMHRNWNFKYYINPRKENLLSNEFFSKLNMSL